MFHVFMPYLLVGSLEFAKVLLSFTLTTKYVLQALIVVGTRLQIRSPERTIHCAEVENLQTLILEGL